MGVWGERGSEGEFKYSPSNFPKNQTLQFINKTWKRTEFSFIEESRQIRQNDLCVTVAIELETLENLGRLDEVSEE